MSTAGLKESNLQTVLEHGHPGILAVFSQSASISMYSNNNYQIDVPEIEVHCDHDNCNGKRWFNCIEPRVIVSSEYNFKNHFLVYKCKNCGITERIYAVSTVAQATPKSILIYKHGEYPCRQPSTPARLIKLVGPDRDIFIKGRRCELQGLGIAAFVYYRRVVESQRNRMIDEIIRVCQKIGTDQQTIELFTRAKDETQFTKSIEMIKDAVPNELLVENHNPFTLLHSALSEGLHNMTDEECLLIATDIRNILQVFAEKLGNALAEHDELKKSIGRLIERNR